MSQPLFTTLLLLGALLLYWLGFTATSLILVGAGAILESWFWWRVLGLGWASRGHERPVRSACGELLSYGVASPWVGATAGLAGGTDDPI